MCDGLLGATRKTNAVLLFGGRQSGKTALLLRLRDRLLRVTGEVATLGALEVPVYVDLTRLNYDARPADLFQTLVRAARTSCAKQIAGFPCENTPNAGAHRTGDLLDDFIGDLQNVSAECGEIEPRFVFLLDEAKRVLGDRFPRGFQDNLFSLLFGESGVQNFTVAMVFAGAQHLYAFSLDDTSPIGSRAIPWHIRNLPETAIQALAKQVFPERADTELVELARFIWESSGGQAGLAAKMLEELARISPPQVTAEVLLLAESTVLHDNRGLLENWSLALTPRARAVAQDFCENEEMSLVAIAPILRDARLEPLLAPRVVEEFQYMGIADVLNGRLIRRNKFFWNYYERLNVDAAVPSAAHDVWRLIETTELSMRDLIKNRYEAAYGGKAESVMRTVLGDKAWTEIQSKKAGSKRKYKYSPEAVERDTMSCMYFGHLKDLMIHGQGWSHFKHMFRDKRELEDKVSAITPVRNDRAHFSEVPAKELDRCRIACDDLSVIVDRELEKHAEDGAELAR
ncbi:hypothetical protein [Accumulibacter sp.]|nr:hypothetical protein [Accumulibacter sp.]